MENVSTSPRRLRPVSIQLSDGQICTGDLVSFTKYASAASPAGACCLELQIENGGNFSQESNDYFGALIKMRGQLEPHRIKLLCWGARKDVWASGMQRDMGAGLIAYHLVKSDGCPSQQSIFDYAPPETIGSVDEQRQYAEAWFNSRRMQSK